MGNTTVRITKQKRRGDKLDAAKAVEVMAEAARAYLSESIVNGYRPADGAARPRKGDGKPFAFDTGTLARGLRVTKTHSTRKRAQVRIVGPESRDEFLVKHDDILTLDGIVADEMRIALDDYLESIDQ